MAETLISDKNYQMWGLIHQLRHILYQIVKNELKSFGLSPAKASTLFVIKYADEQLSPGRIAQLQLRKHNSVSIMIDGLAKEGLVKKTKDKKRKNVIRVTLTEKGEEACKLAMKSEAIPRIFSCLTDEESTQLISSLTKVLDEAGKELGQEERKLPFV